MSDKMSYVATTSQRALFRFLEDQIKRENS